MQAVTPDNLKEIVPLHTTVATEYTNPTVSLPGPNSGLSDYVPYRVRFQYWGKRGIWTFKVLISYDNGLSWGQTILSTLISTIAQDGQQELSVNPNLPTETGHILLMVIAMLSGEPMTPQLSYRADLLLP